MRWLFLFALLAVLAATATAQGAAEPTLDDTEKWLTQTLGQEDNARKTTCSEFNKSDPKSDVKMQSNCDEDVYSIRFVKCDAEIVIFPRHDNADGTNGIDEKGTHVFRFKLGDIDPSSISVSEAFGAYGPHSQRTWHQNPQSMVLLKFHTTNDTNSISSIFPNATSPNTMYEHELWGAPIALSTEYAPRFVKAFKHAINLCGGKASAF